LHNTVFLRLLEKRCRRLRRFKGKNGCSLASWIRVVTVRTVLDHLRQTRDALSRASMRESIETLTHFKADLPEPWQLLDRFEQSEIVRRAMASLPPRDRLFIKLHFMEGTSQSDIAEIMNIPRNTVYSLKHRAIERLKKIIEKQKKN
jgi:RNA polymerase sigma-70 factor (ECF subfamily)